MNFVGQKFVVAAHMDSLLDSPNRNILVAEPFVDFCLCGAACSQTLIDSDFKRCERVSRICPHHVKLVIRIFDTINLGSFDDVESKIVKSKV